MRKHLAIFKKGTGELILTGVKRIESRLSVRKLPPFEQISPGDLVYIKPVGEDIIGQFRVKKVIFFAGMEFGDVRDISEKYGKEIVVDESFWKDHQNAKYLSLIFIGQVDSFITSPLKIPKKDLRGWVVL